MEEKVPQHPRDDDRNDEAEGTRSRTPRRRPGTAEDVLRPTEEGAPMGNHRIRELMTDNPKTVSSDATVVDAARVMRDDDVGLVPVVDGDRLPGR